MLELKTIDISSRDAETASKVVNAARSLGFLYLSNHSIPSALIRQVFAVSKTMFELPRSEKEAYKITPSNRGWSAIGTETLDTDSASGSADRKESFNISASSDQRLPGLLEFHRELLVEFEKECQGLCARLFELLAVGMDLSNDYFKSKHNPASAPSGTITRLLYYPAAERDSVKGEEVVAGAHTDYGSLTLLFQNPGQPGLQLFSPSTNAFHSIPATTSYPQGEGEEMPVLVNVGDQLDLWTSGALKSTLHRVVNETGLERYSIAYFCHPDDATELIPINQTTSGEEIITAGEHLRRRLAATYAY